jgi:rare lipoprotein A
VRINDRGPYADDRILDLSLAAGRRLNMIRSGVVRVRIQVVTPPGPSGAQQDP